MKGSEERLVDDVHFDPAKLAQEEWEDEAILAVAEHHSRCDQMARLYLSGSVPRWHMNPVMAWTAQTDADHQGRCVLLLLALHPGPSLALIRAMATHDVGELGAGDLSYEVKRDNPALAAAHARFEDEKRQELCGPDPVLTLVEAQWLKLIDRLEAACWVLHRNPDEYERADSGWIQDITGILANADALGCGGQVRDLIDDLRWGRW